MQKQEEYLSTRNKIIQITKALKSHYNHGEFLDIDKTFNQLLENIMSIFDRDDLISDLITNEEFHHKFKQKYEDAVEYIKLLESNKLDNKICFDKFNYNSPKKKDNNESNKSVISGVPLDNMSNNGEHFYISDSPDLSLKKKLGRVSVINKSANKEENHNVLMDNEKNRFIYGMEPEKLRDEYIKIFEEKKQIEHDYLIVLEKLARLEDTEKAHQENLIQYEGIVEKAKQMNDEIVNLKERIKQIGQENIQLISLNNQYIEAIETFHSETGNAKSQVLNENTKLRKMERDLIKAKKKINDLERHIEETNERMLKEREERVFIEKQYEDYIYDQENALANMKIESEKIMRENFIEKFLEINQNPNNLNFFYNEQTNKIEIFFEDEKILDMENAKPSEKIDESCNNSINRDIDNQTNIDKNAIEKNEFGKNLILRTKRYSFDGNSKFKRAKLSDISSSNIDSDNEVNKRESEIDSDSEENKKELQSNSLNKNNQREEVNDIIEDNYESVNPIHNFMNKDDKIQYDKGNLVENFEIKENLITNDNHFDLPEHKINEIYDDPIGHDDKLSHLDNKQNSVYIKKLGPSKKRSFNSFIRKKNENKRNQNSKSISFGNVKENDLKKFFTDNNIVDKQIIDNKDYKITDGNSNLYTPKIVKSSLQTNTNNDGSFKKSYNRLFKRHSLAFNSFNNPDKLLFNVKNRLFNSDHDQKFVLENLNVDEKIEEQAKNNDDVNLNNPNELNIYNNNLDNPLFRSTNSSFIHDASFNSKAVRRTTINNFNLISNKLSNIADNEKDLANEINNLDWKKEHEELNNFNISKQSFDSHNDSYQNIKPNNHLNEENNFILEDLIEEDKLITERNNEKNDFITNNQRKLSSIDDGRSFNLLNDNSEEHNNESPRKDSSQVNLIIDELEIDHLPIEDNNSIRNPEKGKVEDIFISNYNHTDADLIQNAQKYDLENEKEIRNIVEDKNEDPHKIKKLKARDSKLNRKPNKKHHRKSLSNINLSTIDLETLTREKKESTIYNLYLNEDKTLFKKKRDHEYNQNLRKESNVIIEDADSPNISRNDNLSDQETKEKNKVSQVYQDDGFDKKLTLKTPNNHPKNQEAEINLYKNLKEGLYLESNKANLKTNFKSDLKEEEEEESFNPLKNHFLKTIQERRKNFISNKSDIEPKEYSRPKSFIDCKNKVSSDKDLKEIEKCIKDINLDSFYKNKNQDKFSETNNKTYKKSFDNSDIKKKILDQFKLPKINNVRDRVLSTNITTNNHYWKYTVNLVPSQDSSFINNQKPNNIPKHLKPKENRNQTFHVNYSTKVYDPAMIDDPNKYFVNPRNKLDYNSDLYNNLNKSNSSFNKFNIDSGRSSKDISPKTNKLQALVNKFPERRKSFLLIDNNIIKSNSRGFTGICIDNQIDDFCILSNKKKGKKASKMYHNEDRVEDVDKSQNKDHMIIFNNDLNINPDKNENDNHVSFNSSLDGSASNSSNNEIDEDIDLNKAYIANRQSSKSFHKKKGEVQLTNNRDFQILDVENENKAFSECGFRIDENYTQNYKRDEYGIDNVSEINLKNRKNILIKFCKEKDIVLNNPVDLENYPTEENLKFLEEKKNFNKNVNNYLDEYNHPLNKNNISFKNMMNESKISNKNGKWRFENKSYVQDTTILKEEQNSKCRRCSIF